MSDLITLTYGGQPLRAVEILGRPWFVAADVAAVIGAADLVARVPLVDLNERGATMRRRRGLPAGSPIVSIAGLRMLLGLTHATAVIERRATDLRCWVNNSLRAALAAKTEGAAA